MELYKVSEIFKYKDMLWIFVFYCFRFLLDCYGHPVKRYGPFDEPKNIEEDIKTELKKRAEMLKMVAKNNNTERAGEL